MAVTTELLWLGDVAKWAEQLRPLK